MKPITGKTFEVKDQLESLGGQYVGGNPATWMVPDDREEEAWALVGGKPASWKPTLSTEEVEATCDGKYLIRGFSTFTILVAATQVKDSRWILKAWEITLRGQGPLKEMIGFSNGMRPSSTKEEAVSQIEEAIKWSFPKDRFRKITD